MEEITELTNPETELIVVKQLPVIEEQLKEVKKRFTEEAEYALSLECTEDSLQSVKKKRAELTKIFNALESKRKEAKKSILAPYEAFEKIYKECVTEIYAPCDRKLSEKINEVESTLKSQKREIAEAYFYEYAEKLHIDFITFDRAGINVTLSVSKKSLHEQIKTFLDKVNDDLQLIDTQENKAEILVEYKQSLNVSKAITAVANRHKEIEAERIRAESIAEEKAIESSTTYKVNEALTVLSAPTATVITEQKEEKKYSTTFTVTGTIFQLKQLKNFLNDGGYEYAEQ